MSERPIDRSAASGDGILDQPAAFWAMVVVATGLAAVLRLGGIDSPSLWVDEFFTISRAGNEDLHWINAFGYLPTRFTLWLAGAELSSIDLTTIPDWIRLGVTERAARLGPCLVGIATVPLLALLARPVVGGGVAGVAALILALTPWHIYWSQTARFYTTQFLFANAFLMLFARAVLTGNRGWFAAAIGCAVLGFVSHFTTLLMLGCVFAGLALAWLVRRETPNLVFGMATLVGVVAIAACLILIREFDTKVPGSLSTFSTQSWDPSLPTMILGTVLRIEPVTLVMGIFGAWIAWSRRDLVGLGIAAVAVGVPLAIFVLSVGFPIGPRYYLTSFFSWALLAATWCVAVDRRLSGDAGKLAGLSGVAVALVAVGYSTFLYAWDGSGQRTRWRDAYAYVREHAKPGAAVYASTGGFESQYYWQAPVARLRDVEDLSTLAPGSWVVARSRGTKPPGVASRFDIKARYEIASKPWSWVLYVMQVPPR